MSEITGSGYLGFCGRTGWWNLSGWWHDNQFSPIEVWFDWITPIPDRTPWGSWWLATGIRTVATVPTDISNAWWDTRWWTEQDWWQSGNCAATFGGQAIVAAHNKITGAGSLSMSGSATLACTTAIVGTGALSILGDAAVYYAFVYGWYPTYGWWPNQLGWWFSPDGNYEQQWSN